MEWSDSGSSLEEESSFKHMSHMSGSSRKGCDKEKLRNKGKSVIYSPINADFTPFVGTAGFTNQ